MFEEGTIFYPSVRFPLQAGKPFPMGFPHLWGDL